MCEVFSDQAVHSFQLKLLRKEISRAEQGRRLFEENLERIGAFSGKR